MTDHQIVETLSKIRREKRDDKCANEALTWAIACVRHKRPR